MVSGPTTGPLHQEDEMTTTGTLRIPRETSGRFGPIVAAPSRSVRARREGAPR